MLKLLIAIKFCNADYNKGYHDVIRETWGQNLAGADLRFFAGNGSRNLLWEPREVILDCPDDYLSLSLKTRAICQWAAARDYEGAFLCDTDTFLIPSFLMALPLEKYDYIGKIDRPIGVTFPYRSVGWNETETFYPECYPWASGGYGYFLSKKALTLIANETSMPVNFAEDLVVGQLLGPRLRSGELKALHTPPNTYSWHYPKGGNNWLYDPAWMRRLYEEHQ